MNEPLILDIATAPLPNAADFLEPLSAPANYKDPAKIAAAIAEKAAAQLAGAALDLDLARITAIGFWIAVGERGVMLCRDEVGEGAALTTIAREIADRSPTLITYAGLRFDLPMLQRRARYLGVPFPKLDLDRYRSPHRDLCALLAGNERERMHSLDFMCRRLGWTDLLPKPLAGEEEAKVFESGRWAELEASVRRDVEAARRLALWMGEIEEGADLGF